MKDMNKKIKIIEKISSHSQQKKNFLLWAGGGGARWWSEKYFIFYVAAHMINYTAFDKWFKSY